MLRLLSIVRSSPAEWLRFVRAYLWLFRAKRLMGRARGNQWLFGEHGPKNGSDVRRDAGDEDRALIKKRVAAISRASRYPVEWAYCLQRSLALSEWLAKDGIFTEVRYGVRKRSGSFDAHAWVVHDEKIINDSVRHVSTFAQLRSLDDYGAGSRGQIQNALITSRTESESEGNPA